MNLVSGKLDAGDMGDTNFVPEKLDAGGVGDMNVVPVSLTRATLVMSSSARAQSWRKTSESHGMVRVTQDVRVSNLRAPIAVPHVVAA